MMKDSSQNSNISKTSQNLIKSLYSEYAEQVYGFAYKHLKSNDRSHDIVQEVFIVLCQKDLSEVKNIRSYIFQITHHKVIDLLRIKAKNRKLREEMWSVIARKQQSADEAIVEKEYFQHLEEAKARLTPQQRLIFDLSRSEGLSHQKIAEKLELSPNTVKNHMVSALKTLRQYLNLNSDIVIAILLCGQWLLMQ